MSVSKQPELVPTGESTAELRAGDEQPITVIGNQAIRDGFEPICLDQAINLRRAPGVTDVVINPDAHMGFGAPTGSVMVSPTHIYPGPVGVDIKCSMSLIQFDVPAEEVQDNKTRRALISAISRKIPTGVGKRSKKNNARRITKKLGEQIVVEGASEDVLEQLGIPTQWSDRCEDASHSGHNATSDALAIRLERMFSAKQIPNFMEKLEQLGSYGGGNHFGECEVVRIEDTDRSQAIAKEFLLKENCVAFLSHCGSRGFGHKLATNQFRGLQQKFSDWHIPFPAGDKELVYAPVGSREADDYLDDMALAANFATVNHLLINALVLEAFQEVLPGTSGALVYYISHNIVRHELVDNQPVHVHRKGATRAFPAGHPELQNTPFESIGHPILLPGNPRDGSVVMVADEGVANTCFSINHGAGRCLSRKEAKKNLSQEQVDQEFDSGGILTNCRQYPLDEAPAAYKNFSEVLHSVTSAGLASKVASLSASFVIKDSGEPDDDIFSE